MYDPTKPYSARIKALARETWDGNPYLEMADGLYNSFRHKHAGTEIDHTDGLGTKGQIHWHGRTLREAATDALAMNVNDLALVGAKAYKAQAHLMVPSDDHEAIVEIVGHLCDLCKARRITLTGGETSVHDNLTGMELSLTVSGVVVDKRPRPMLAAPGDRLVLIASSGVHSNGLTWVRKLYEGSPPAWASEPTRMYDVAILEKRLPINAAMHITGGAWSKLLGVLPDGCLARVARWEIPACFREIYERWKAYYRDEACHERDHPDLHMYRTFNMGVGMVLSVPAKDADWVAVAVGGTVGGEVLGGHPGTQVEVESDLHRRPVVFRR